MQENRILSFADQLLLWGYIGGCCSSFLIGVGSVVRLAHARSLPETPIPGTAPTGSTSTTRARDFFG